MAQGTGASEAGAPGGQGGLDDPHEVRPLARPFEVSIRPPGSKSVTNRAILLAALARGESRLRGALVEADDSAMMLRAVAKLGAKVEVGGDEVVITGVDGRWCAGGATRLDLHNAGTATRFLAASAVLGDAPITIDGNARMRERPIGELSEAIRALGVRVDDEGSAGCPPVTIHPPKNLAELSRELAMGKTRSGQFISAMLILGSALPGGLTLSLSSSPTSASYVRMTLEMLSRLGVSVRTSADLGVIRIGPPKRESEDYARAFDGFEMDIEPDASGATYFWAAAGLIKGARCEIPGLGVGSMQGDAQFPDILARMGVRVEAEREEDEGIVCEGTGKILPVLADMSQMPDAAVTLAVVCAFAKGSSVIRGVGTLRVKECDRIEALRVELGKIGVVVEADAAGDADAMTIVPPEGGVDCSKDVERVEFDTYGDHRMAMALALVGLRRPNVFIRDPGCVAKTYPGFWEEFGRLKHSPRARRSKQS